MIRLSKLYKEIQRHMRGSNVRYALESMWALLNAMLLTIINALPAGRFRRAISGLVTIVLIIVIIVAGVAIILVLVIFPGQTSTTTIYP